MSLINCEVSLILTWSIECVITSMERRVITNRRRDTSPSNATFQVTDTKLYVPDVTLSIEDDNNFLEQLKSGLKELLNGINIDQKWLITKTNKLNYLNDPTFNKVNELFVL